jgi:hypothetical protein
MSYEPLRIESSKPALAGAERFGEKAKTAFL